MLKNLILEILILGIIYAAYMAVPAHKRGPMERSIHSHPQKPWISVTADKRS